MAEAMPDSIRSLRISEPEDLMKVGEPLSHAQDLQPGKDQSRDRKLSEIASGEGSSPSAGSPLEDAENGPWESSAGKILDVVSDNIGHDSFSTSDSEAGPTASLGEPSDDEIDGNISVLMRSNATPDRDTPDAASPTQHPLSQSPAFSKASTANGSSRASLVSGGGNHGPMGYSLPPSPSQGGAASLQGNAPEKITPSAESSQSSSGYIRGRDSGTPTRSGNSQLNARIRQNFASDRPLWLARDVPGSSHSSTRSRASSQSAIVGNIPSERDVSQPPLAHGSPISMGKPPDISRLGLLSFSRELSSATGSGGSYSDGVVAVENAFIEDGMRRREDRTRKLETENMELRLKLQQYREMSASEQEISRVKRQVARAERRIDDLEQALERKNETIRQLSEERDLASQRARSPEEIKELQETIMDLQTAISELEEQAVEEQREASRAVAAANDEMPNLVSKNAGVADLVDTIRSLSTENSQQSATISQLSSLKDQYMALRESLSESGRKGDPIINVKQLVTDSIQQEKDISELQEALAQERRKYRSDLATLKETFRRKLDESAHTIERLSAEVTSEQEARATLTFRASELEEVAESQHQRLTEARAMSYEIIRRFFAELFEVMGDNFQDTVESQLQDIISRAQAEGLSKVPLLADLLVKYTHDIAVEVVNSRTEPEASIKIQALEREIKSLEDLLSLHLNKAGADAVLQARLRDLQRELKSAQEKRKSDWLDFRQTVDQLRRDK